MLFQGCSVSELGHIFGMDNRTVAKKIQSVQSCGARAGHPIYQIRDAAPFLVKPAGDIGEYIRGMHHDELPPLLNRNYWAGQREKLRFEEETGDLWRTADVLDLYATTFQTVRTHLLLLGDSVERETQFSDDQREKLKNLIDGTLENVRDAIVDKFGKEVFDEPKSDVEEDDDAYFSVPEDAADDFDDEGSDPFEGL